MSKARRYWPGKAPDWCDGAAAEEADDLRTACLCLENKGLRRLKVAKNQLEKQSMDHRRVRRPEVVSTVVQERETEEDEEKRRMRIREMRLLLGEEEELLPHEEAEAEDESEYETESEDEQQLYITAMAKPALFVPKPQRVTIAERARLEEWGRRLEELAKKRLEGRRVETRQIVVEEIRKEGQADKMTLNDDEDGVDTDDELNEAEEYELWKHREIARIKRARDGEPEIKKMSISNKEYELTKLDPLARRPKKRQRRFLQKYYHKGSFFQEDADDTRDFSAPTGEDKMDKSILPKVMQVKNFGRSGRTKCSMRTFHIGIHHAYSHLLHASFLHDVTDLA